MRTSSRYVPLFLPAPRYLSNEITNAIRNQIFYANNGTNMSAETAQTVSWVRDPALPLLHTYLCTRQLTDRGCSRWVPRSRRSRTSTPGSGCTKSIRRRSTFSTRTRTCCLHSVPFFEKPHRLLILPFSFLFSRRDGTVQLEIGRELVPRAGLADSEWPYVGA